MIEVNKENEIVLKKVLCIQYLFYFQKDNAEVKALINLGSKVNAMTLEYALKLDLKICHTNIKA